jgi:hypothetical protein
MQDPARGPSLWLNSGLPNLGSSVQEQAPACASATDRAAGEDKTPMSTTKHAAPTVTPLVISDATALAVVGLTARQYRAWLRASGTPHVKIGKRTVARADRVLEALDAAVGTTPRPIWSEDAVVATAARGGR